MAESNRVISRLLSFILLFDCQEAFHCCLVVACSNRINMISIQCHRVGEWSAGKPECGNCIVPVWGNHDYAGLNEVAIPFKQMRNYLVCYNILYKILHLQALSLFVPIYWRLYRYMNHLV